MKNNLQLINFKSTDNLVLPGLLYEPEKRTDRAAIFLHGNGSASIFYNREDMDLYSKSLNSVGISFFPFNNRGAHWMKKLNRISKEQEERSLYGMTYELIKECIFDIEGAINFLKNLGYRTFYLIGESTGANKIVVYNYYKPKNPVSKYILVSGGDDLGLYYNLYFKKNKKRFFDILKKSEEKIKKGKGRNLVSKSILPDELISYQSLYDTINPEGDYNIFPFNEYLNNLKLSKKKLFREFRKINKPTLAVYGELDEICFGRVPECVEILRKESSPGQSFTFKIIKEADHGYHGKEKELVNEITNWLK